MIRVGTVGGAVGLTAVASVRRLEATEEARRAPRLGMVIDLSRCTGCNACSVACKAENGIRLGSFRAWVSEKETGRYPRVSRVFLPRLCNHCENAPCLYVCPTGATHRHADGIVDIDKSKCIGCRHCMGACPYNARYFNPEHDPEAGSYPARTFGTVDKCDFCAKRVEAGLAPACVDLCPQNARIFGDLDDPASAVSRLAARRDARPLLPGLGTSPRVFYVGGDPGLFEEA